MSCKFKLVSFCQPFIYLQLQQQFYFLMQFKVKDGRAIAWIIHPAPLSPSMRNVDFRPDASRPTRKCSCAPLSSFPRWRADTAAGRCYWPWGWTLWVVITYTSQLMSPERDDAAILSTVRLSLPHRQKAQQGGPCALAVTNYHGDAILGTTGYCDTRWSSLQRPCLYRCRLLIKQP